MKRVMGLLLLLAMSCSREPTPPTPEQVVDGGSSEVPSGADNFGPGHQTAWFLGAGEIVNYCLEVAPDFGVDETEAAQVLREVIEQWHRYVPQRLPSYRTLAPQRQLTATWFPQKACNERTTHVAFYLGVQNKVTALGLVPGSHPTAYVQRLEYFPDRHWSRGYGWVAKQGSLAPGFPNWKRRGTLRAILLHEIGHMLGNGHVAGTIMDERISYFLHGVGVAPYNLERIDSFRELLSYDDGQVNFTDRLLGYHHADWEKIFDALTGRRPVGRAWARVQRRPGVPDWSLKHGFRDATPEHHLTFSDEKGVFPIRREPLSHYRSLSLVGPRLFKLASARGPWESDDYLATAALPTYHETLVTHDGRRVAAYFEYVLGDPTDLKISAWDVAQIRLFIDHNGLLQQVSRFWLEREAFPPAPPARD